MTSRQYKYCVICRGEGELMRCSQCAKAFHCECVNLKCIQKAYVCDECTGDATEYVTRTKSFVTNSLISRWTTKMKAASAMYLKSIKHLLVAFTSKKDLDHILKIKPPARFKGISTRNLCETPPYLSNVTMRDYQLEGTSTLISWFSRGVGGILADEMGLGKTLQTIALLSYLKEELELTGPHLVITPLAVLQNWANEFDRFAPQMSFKKIHGSAAERDQLMTDPNILSCKFDVYLTTYETLICEEGFFTDSWKWATITIDEGHRIKNENAALRRALNRLSCPFRLLLTGTPLQNNLHELWALLNYLLPQVFKDSSMFDTGADIQEDTMDQDVVKKARVLLENCFMLRREKKDVETALPPKIFCKLYVQMTELQKKWYRTILSLNDPRNVDTTIKGDVSLLTNMQLQHVLSQLQKVVNHPKQILLKREADRHKENQRVLNAAYGGSEFVKPRQDLLAPDRNSAAWLAEEELRALRGERLIKTCGKLAVLDRLLRRLKENGSRVLLFSQYTETLNVLEEYVNFRFGAKGHVYLRLDGKVNRVIRELDIRRFNAAGSPIFIYLISTKAGGQGINLATANSVVLYDTAWNPQVDLQAQDRAHRIGQSQQVTVYRLLTADSFEERVMQMAERKLLLDHFVIARKDSKPAAKEKAADDNKISYLSDARSIRRIKRASRGKGDCSDQDMKLSMSETWAVLRHGTEKIFKTDASSARVGESWGGDMTDAQLDAFVDSCLMDSGGASLPSVRRVVDRFADNDVDREVNGFIISPNSGSTSTESAVGANGDTVATVPPSLVSNGVRTIFDLEESTAAASKAAHLSGDDDDDEGVNLDDDADVGDNSDDAFVPEDIQDKTTGSDSGSRSGDANTLEDAPLSADGMTNGKQQQRSLSCDKQGLHQQQSHTGGDDQSWTGVETEEELKRFPKRRRIAAQRYVPVLPTSTPRTKRKRIHEEDCFCCDDGGIIIECAVCPKVYHLECVDLKRVPKGYWQCHWHSCYTCLRSASNSGGVQFRCVDCPLAYCFDCFPKHIELKTIDPPAEFVANFHRRGFEISPNSLFFRCNECTLDREEKLAKIETEKKRLLKHDTLRKQIYVKRDSITRRLQQLIEENKAQQEVQWREIAKIKDALDKLHVVCAPSYAAALSPHEQSQNKYYLDLMTRQHYLAQENMRKFATELHGLRSQLHTCNVECNAELSRLEEELRKERAAEEAAEREAADEGVCEDNNAGEEKDGDEDNSEARKNKGVSHQGKGKER